MRFTTMLIATERENPIEILASTNSIRERILSNAFPFAIERPLRHI
jgi:hypothetical protein